MLAGRTGVPLHVAGTAAAAVKQPGRVWFAKNASVIDSEQLHAKFACQPSASKLSGASRLRCASTIGPKRCASPADMGHCV